MPNDELTPTGFNDQQVSDKLVDIVIRMCKSDDAGERTYGVYLFQHIRFLPSNEIIPTLRRVSQEMEDATAEFTKRWMRLCGE